MLRPSILLALLSLLLCNTALALSISFEAVDLPEAPGDPDRWAYHYLVAPFEWASVPDASGFSVYFPVEESRNLVALAPGPGADWDVIVLQPDPVLPAEGLYDALALSLSPAFDGDFAVAFDWLGDGVPGGQPFDVYDGSFAPVASGLTTPEPSTALLVLLGLALCGGTWQESR